MEIDNDASRSQIQLEPRPAPSILPPPRPAWQDRTVLETQFIEAWNRFEDLELQRLIVSRYIEANPSGRPTMDQVRDMVVNILRLVGARLSARDAIVLLLQAGLNAALAVQQYIRTRHPRAVVEAQEARNPPAPEVIAKGEQCYAFRKESLLTLWQKKPTASRPRTISSRCQRMLTSLRSCRAAKEKVWVFNSPSRRPQLTFHSTSRLPPSDPEVPDPARSKKVRLLP